jgi:hypothetical protein
MSRAEEVRKVLEYAGLMCQGNNIYLTLYMYFF